jgi:hypothetical protein
MNHSDKYLSLEVFPYFILLGVLCRGGMMGKFVSLIGQRFGKLLVVGQETVKLESGNMTYQKCLCDCGNIKLLQTYRLTVTNTTNCGECSRTTDISGQRFGKLVAIEYIGMDKKRNARWKCQCDCGRILTINGSALRKGRTKSCGCSERTPSLSRGESYFNRLFATYIKGANLRNLSFELTKEFFRDIIGKDCFYCGAPPVYKEYTTYNKNGGIICNGIDRVDSNRGYTEDNVVPCCSMCNVSKWSYDFDEFLLMVKRIYENLNLENYVKKELQINDVT